MMSSFYGIIIQNLFQETCLPILGFRYEFLRYHYPHLEPIRLQLFGIVPLTFASIRHIPLMPVPLFGPFIRF